MEQSRSPRATLLVRKAMPVSTPSSVFCEELPPAYRELIGRLVNSEQYRRTVEDEIADIFNGASFRLFGKGSEWELEICWDNKGASFRAPGWAVVFPLNDDHYESREVHSPEQRLILLTCLSIYLSETYSQLYMYSEHPEGLPAEPLEGQLTTRLSFSSRRKEPKVLRY